MYRYFKIDLQGSTLANRHTYTHTLKVMKASKINIALHTYYVIAIFVHLDYFQRRGMFEIDFQLNVNKSSH